MTKEPHHLTVFAIKLLLAEWKVLPYLKEDGQVKDSRKRLGVWLGR
jgi:hypothetical protein